MVDYHDEPLRKLEAFRRRAERLANASLIPSSPSPGADLVAGTLGRIASGWVKRQGLDSFIPGRSAGTFVRNLVRADAKVKVRRERESWVQERGEEVNSLLQDVDDLLRTISMPASGLTPSGNSHLLRRKLNRVRRLKTPQARARNLAIVLEEIGVLRPIPNKAIPHFLATQKVATREEAIALVTNLEMALRTCVREKLSQLSSTWWHDRVPPSIRRRAEQRQERDEAAYPRISTPEDPLSYVGFADYDDIILEEGNWKRAFQGVFGDLQWLSVKLKELEPIRNALMHSRGVTRHALDKLRVTAMDLLSKMK